MWTQQWPIMDIQEIDKKARKIFIDNGEGTPVAPIRYLPTTRERKQRFTVCKDGI